MFVVPSVGWKTGGGVLSSVSVFDHATSETTTVAYPAGIRGGDVALLMDDSVSFFSTPASVTPGGFTLINSLTGGSSAPERVNFWRRVLTGSESGLITGMGADFDNISVDKVLLIIRGNVAISAVTALSPWKGQITSGDPTAQTVPASGQTTPLIIVAMGSSDVVPTFTTASPAFDAEITVGLTRFGHKSYNSSPANLTVDIGVNGGVQNALSSGYLRFT